MVRLISSQCVCKVKNKKLNRYERNCMNLTFKLVKKELITTRKDFSCCTSYTSHAFNLFTLNKFLIKRNDVSWFQQIASLTFGCVFCLCISFTLDFTRLISLQFSAFQQEREKKHHTEASDKTMWMFLHLWVSEWLRREWIEEENIYVTIISSFKIHWRFDKKLFRHTLYFSHSHIIFVIIALHEAIMSVCMPH